MDSEYSCCPWNVVPTRCVMDFCHFCGLGLIDRVMSLETDTRDEARHVLRQDHGGCMMYEGGIKRTG